MALKIAYLSLRDAQDPRRWSGTPFYAAESLAAAGAQVDHLGPMPAWPMQAMQARRRIERALGVRQSRPGASHAYAHLCARVARARIAQLPERPDIVFTPAGSVPLAYLRTDVPIVYLSDATVRLLVDYYPEFTGLSAHTVKVADALERAAIARAALLVYPTRWAAASAVRDYGADPGKVVVAPLGANIVDAEIDRSAPRPDDGVCRLLFVGVDWQRKGGEVALNVLRVLRARGLRCELTVVGTAPPEPPGLPGTEFIPYLDKSAPADRARLNGLYHRADFFVLPTRTECYGIVFCEAAAYGLPVLATRTGGVPDVVREGVTGFTLPPGDDGAGYAARIAEVWADPARHAALRAASRAEFETRLNWTAWSRTVLAAMERLVAP